MNFEEQKLNNDDSSEEKSKPNKAELRSKQKLYRSSENAIISGVCAGIAEYFNVNAAIVRLIFAASVLLGGWGFAVYLLASFLIPAKPYAYDKRIFSGIDSKRLFGLLLIVLGFYFTFKSNTIINVLSLFDFTDTVIFSFLVALVGLWILLKGDSQFVYVQVLKKNKLYKSKENARLQGLCSGLASYMNADVNSIRLIWLLISFLTLGAGAAVYFIISSMLQSEQTVSADEK